MSYGTVQVGRLTLRETFELKTDVNAGTGIRSVTIAGEESQPPLTFAEVQQRHEDIMTMRDSVQSIVWTNKSNHNGFYVVEDISASETNYITTVDKFGWQIRATRIGPDNAAEIESRLTGVTRQNNFSLTGEKWHAPSIGHYAYYPGANSPGSVSRTGADGAIIVYRSIPAGINPRWGVAATAYMNGRVKILVSGLERTGNNLKASAGLNAWELNNGLVRVKPINGTLEISAWSGGAWRPKNWGVFTNTADLVDFFDQMAVIRNDPEMVTIRLVKSLVSSGVATLDLTLRRGSRFVEGYMRRSVSASELKVRLNTLEACVDTSAQGYLVATADDADGNRFAVGSAKTFTKEANGGVVRATTTELDFWIGVQTPGATPASGDAATDLRNQYIGAMAEFTMAVRR